jgi:hypothetical protein
MLLDPDPHTDPNTDYMQVTVESVKNTEESVRQTRKKVEKKPTIY